MLARFGGATAQRGAETSATVLREHGCEADAVEDDAALWQRQREHQRSTGATVVKVSGLPADLPRRLRAADALGGTLVGRAALGLCVDHAARRRRGGADAARGPDAGAVRVADAPEDVRNAVDPWHTDAGEPLVLLRRLKHQFDPAGVCNPGLYVGGI